MSLKNSVKQAAQNKLRAYEKTVEDGLLSFVEVGKALGMIRLEKLYALEGWDDFDSYVEARFTISPRHADRLISAARVVLLLGPTGRLIKNESTARELAVFGRDEAEKMRAVVEAATVNDKVTAARIRTARDEMFPEYRTIDGEFREGGPREIEAPKTEPTVGAGAPYAPRPLPTVLCPIPRDLDRCNVCGGDLPERNAGYLRCDQHDRRREHIAWPTDGGQWLECRLCYPPSKDGIQTSAESVPAAGAPMGEPDVDDQAASTDGTPTGSSSPEPVGVTPEERIEGEAVEGPTATPPALTVEHATDSPAADPIPEPPVEPSPTAEPQQPGQDSPPDVGSEGFPRRAETDHQRVAGVSPAGVAPAPPIAVEPELEGGGYAPPRESSSSSDSLMAAFASLVLHLAGADPEALGPVLHDDDVELLLQHADDIENFVGRLIKARTP